MKSGTQYVHGTSDDFKNHIRDVNAFIGESDAQMLINKMENRKNFVPHFTFHYLVKNGELVAMFWDDEVAKCNYKEFGDIISFDATFRTSKYDMDFVSFTGIDNHLKCVNFGSGMLLKEETEAYTWLLTSFMTAHEKQPTMVVTDQDGAMKRAIEVVLIESKHILCMWHIMQKVPAKASNKGGRRGERIKSGREIAMKAKAKRAQKCGYCVEKTNKHTKNTFPSNPKYIVKLATIEAAAEQERITSTSATEQEERNSDSTHIADKEQSNTAS
nr:hypothetical protein [Tanacetum cinerariifolium]